MRVIAPMNQCIVMINSREKFDFDCCTGENDIDGGTDQKMKGARLCGGGS